MRCGAAAAACGCVGPALRNGGCGPRAICAPPGSMGGCSPPLLMQSPSPGGQAPPGPPNIERPALLDSVAWVRFRRLGPGRCALFSAHPPPFPVFGLPALFAQFPQTFNVFRSLALQSVRRKSAQILAKPFMHTIFAGQAKIGARSPKRWRSQ